MLIYAEKKNVKMLKLDREIFQIREFDLEQGIYLESRIISWGNRESLLPFRNSQAKQVKRSKMCHLFRLMLFHVDNPDDVDPIWTGIAFDYFSVMTLFFHDSLADTDFRYQVKIAQVHRLKSEQLSDLERGIKILSMLTP